MARELSRKADIALADLNSNGGILMPEQSDTFIRLLIDQPTLLNAVRFVPMNAPIMYVNKIGFGSRILNAANELGGAGLASNGSVDANDGNNSRYLAADKRAKPTLERIELQTSEVIAEIRIPYEVIEDNIERGDITNTLLQLIAERAALDLEELLILGGTDSGDAYLSLQQGILARISSNVVNANGQPISVGLFNNLKKSLPTKYRRNLNAMRWFFSMDTESDYRVQVASRVGALGDATLTGNDPLKVLGVPLIGAALMPNTKGILTNPQNILFGIQRDVRIETDRNIRSREVVVVLTARIALQIEQEDACAMATNVGSAV